MDIFFADPDEIPLPPDEVRILDFIIDPYTDGKRIRVKLELTPFQRKPNGDIVVKDVNGDIVASASFIEAITPRLELTLHMRQEGAGSPYEASLALFYTEEIDDQENSGLGVVKPERMEVDQISLQFEISN